MGRPVIDRAAATSPFAFPLFRAVWAASTASHAGGLIQSVGASWMMLSLAHSAKLVALVQTAATLPIVLFSLFAGAVADGHDRRHVMIVAQVFMLLVAAGLAILATRDLLTPALVLGGTFLIGCGSAFHAPAWQASVGDLVPRPVVPAAIVANGLGFNLSRTVSPAIGGLVVAVAGASAAFLVNAISYLGLIVVLLRWRSGVGDAPVRQAIVASMLGGVRHAIASPPLRVAMVRAGVFGTMSSAVLALMPLVARDLVGGGASVYGTLLGLFGVGSILGSFANRRLRRALSSERIVRIASLAVAGGAIGIGAEAGFVVTATALVAAGAGTVLALSTFNVVVQMSAPRAVLARSLALYQMATFAGIALGSSVFGIVAQHHGVAVALFAAAALQVSIMPLGIRWAMPDQFEPQRCAE